MHTSFWERRFPTLVGLLLLLSAILGTVYVTQSKQFLRSNATQSTQYTQLMESNISDTGFSLSFITTNKVSATVKVGETLEKATTILDDRDEVNGSLGTYTVHYFTLKNLLPSKTYLFRIQIENTIYDNNKKGFPAKTAPQLADTSLLTDTLRGRVQSTSNINSDLLVFAKIKGASMLSTVIKSSGEFLIPLAGLRTEDVTSFYQEDTRDTLTVEILNNQVDRTVQTTLEDAADTLSAISLDQQEQHTNPSTSHFVIDTNVLGDSTVQQAIITPQEGQALIDQKPLFQGNGKPLQPLTLQLKHEITQVDQSSILVGSDGTWKYQVPSLLPVGAYRLTVNFLTNGTIENTITRSFTILPSGLQVVEIATASATITPLPTSIPFPTIIPTLGKIPKTAATEPLVVGIGMGGMFLFIGIVALWIL